MAKSQRFDLLQHAVKFPDGQTAQLVRWSGERIQLTAASGASADTALPANTRLVEIRALEDVFIRFGIAGVEASADVDSILFPRGVQVVPVPLDSDNNPFTHVSVIRALADDGTVQFEKII